MAQEVIVNFILPGLLVMILGFIVGWFASRKISQKNLKNTRKLGEKIIADAQREAETRKKELILEAKDEWYNAKLKFENETRETKKELEKRKSKLKEREENIDRKVDFLEKREFSIEEKKKNLDLKFQAISEKNDQLARIIERHNEQLEKIAGMSTEEARDQLVRNLEDEAKHKAAKRIKEIKDEAERTANKISKKIITLSIERCAADHVTETTVSAVGLPNDEMKGRIIGREGRNIRSFENATGIDVIIDDTPEAVILSGFDPIRREIARLALEKLIRDGRIHPGRIEDVVEKTRDELMEEIRDIGERTYLDLNIHGLHPEIIKLLGRLQYRTSYGQNVLQHSKEVAYITGLLAGELGLDVDVAKRAGLLHDIGKAADHELEGTHASIGADLAKKYRESEMIVNSIEAHHEEVEAQSLIAHLVSAADAISGARPGARRETIENYIKRLEKLERIADTFDGVEKAYAIQAGREVRILVNSRKISDDYAIQLVEDISRKIEEEMEYPGQIKVVVIRETRAIDYAK